MKTTRVYLLASVVTAILALSAMAEVKAQCKTCFATVHTCETRDAESGYNGCGCDGNCFCLDSCGDPDSTPGVGMNTLRIQDVLNQDIAIPEAGIWVAEAPTAVLERLDAGMYRGVKLDRVYFSDQAGIVV